MNKLYRCDPDKNLICAKNWCYRNGRDCYRCVQKKYKMNIFKRIKEFIGGKSKWKMKSSNN